MNYVGATYNSKNANLGKPSGRRMGFSPMQKRIGKKFSGADMTNWSARIGSHKGWSRNRIVRADRLPVPELCRT
ncbi:hypothetical protein KM043_013467 [Ampulex compressa]|nr:hypothetical protein KM043_013467 [Ampulex compressa]